MQKLGTILGTDTIWLVDLDIHNEWICSRVNVEQVLQIIDVYLKQWRHVVASARHPPQFLQDSSGNFVSKLFIKN